MKYYDNTRLAAYKTCPRYYYLRHKRHLAREATSPALVFGLSWHEAMDILWGLAHTDKSDSQIVDAALAAFVSTWVGEGMPEPAAMDQARMEQLAPRTPMIAAEMLYNYLAQRRQLIASGEVIGIEVPFAVPLNKAKTMYYIGRLDKVFKHPTIGTLVIEHKTTSAYAKVCGFRKDYLQSWSPNGQIDGYLFAAHMLYGDSVKGVHIDAALVHKTVHDKFTFIPIDRQFEQLDQWLVETQDWITRVEAENARYDEFKTIEQDSSYFGYPKDTGSCNLYAGCSFRDICKFVVNPDTTENFTGYKVKPWSPFDILKMEKLGLENEK